MKKSLLFLFCLVSLNVFAQQRLVVITKDGERESIPVWQIERLEIQEFEKPETATPTEAEAVVLGSSGLRWAPWNIGATKAEEVGFLFGWGNPDAENHSTDLKYFPSPQAENNIITTEHDVAQYYWGEPWRMPSDKEMDELFSCKWEWVPDMNAYKVINPADDEKYIYLPATGYAHGEDSLFVGEEGFYWSGSVADNDSAFYLHFPAESTDLTLWQVLEGYRSKRFAIRPVYGAYEIPVGVKSTDFELRSANTAAISISIEGEGEQVECGVYYSKVSGFSTESANCSQVIIIDKLDGTYSTVVLLSDLDYSTSYYYRAYIKIGTDIIAEADEHQFTTNSDDRIVDLGLSVKWARWNIGATAINEYGGMYLWGETPDASLAHNGDDVSNLNESDYDYATLSWGGEWRIPTRADFEELNKYCEVTHETIDGTFGVKFSRNGDFVFFPLAGIGYQRKWVKQAGYYWTSENNAGYNAYQCIIQPPIYDDYFQILSATKSDGHSIRAVYGKSDPSHFIENPDVGNEEDPNANPDDTDEDPEEPVTPVTPEAEDIAAVDLGLPSGTLWANMNVGAEHEYDSGDYFAWGETEPKDSYLLIDYLYYDTDSDVFSIIGEARGATYELAYLPDYDAATVRWGGTWRMPTYQQFKELKENCTWTWTSVNYVPGYRVTSTTNGNSVFFPAVSYYSGRSKGENGTGRYWTSSLYPYDDKDRFSWAIEMTTDSNVLFYNPRQDGMPIRPVRPKQ